MSLLEHELREQPRALARLIERGRGGAASLAPLLRRADVRYVLIAARGSSANAARYAQYLLGRAQRVPVALATPSLFTLYSQPPRLDGALVIGISQSGQSPDVVEVLAEARRQGRPTIAITNAPSSPLAELAEGVLGLEAGDERSVAATKTYVNSLGAIALLFAWTMDDERALEELQRVPELLERQIALSWTERQRMTSLAGITGGTVIARGINYCTAHEIALKIRELSGLVFESYSAADLMHGPVAALAPGWPVLAVAPTGPAFAAVAQAAAAVAARGARVVPLTDHEPFARRGDPALSLLPGTPEWLSPLVAVIPGQVAALELARTRTADVDRPHGLSKVTLTR